MKVNFTCLSLFQSRYYKFLSVGVRLELKPKALRASGDHTSTESQPQPPALLDMFKLMRFAELIHLLLGRILRTHTGSRVRSDGFHCIRSRSLYMTLGSQLCSLRRKRSTTEKKQKLSGAQQSTEEKATGSDNT